MNDATQITNILHRYAELMDAGDLSGTAELFARARVKVGGGVELFGADAMEAHWRRYVRIYPCGTPRTKHVVTNAIVDIDEAGTSATARSYYTVHQATDVLQLQVICMGRYHDTFSKDADGWYLTGRDYTMLDLVGDLSHHLLPQEQ